MKKLIAVLVTLSLLVTGLAAATVTNANSGWTEWTETWWDWPGETLTADYLATENIDLMIELEDSDGLPDDMIEVYIDNILVLTLPMYTGSVSTTVPLDAGLHEIVLLYVAFDFSPGTLVRYRLNPASATGLFPEEVTLVGQPGDNWEVDKYLGVPEITPNPDIYFLADTTGSMDPGIAAIQASAGSIMATILAAQPTAQFGVGSYKDYPFDPLPPFYHQQSITADTTAVSTAIGTWAAGGGSDGPEAQFYAMNQIADPSDPQGIGWRGLGTPIVVWFGDAPAHDPVPNAATGLGYDIDEANVTADLVAAGIKVIAISLNTGGYPAGIDDDPNIGGGDYAFAYGTVEDGSAGQASNIAAATGGAYLFTATPEEAADAVLAGIEELTTDVWWEVTADPGLTVTLDPAVHLGVSGGAIVSFAETIEVTGDVPVSTTFTATVAFYANSYPDEGAIIGEQTITVIVVVIDIKPWSYPNSINTKSNGVVPVGILGSDTFDVTAVDVTTLAFGPSGATPAHDLTDPDVHNGHLVNPDLITGWTANEDGYVDLVTHFRQKDTGLAAGDTIAWLTGQVDVGGGVYMPFIAYDSVLVRK
jgi:hypothetical protein